MLWSFCLKSAQKTAFEIKRRQHIAGKVIQRLFNIDLYTYLAVYRYRWSKRQIQYIYYKTRTLLVTCTLACLEIAFVFKGVGAVILLFRLEYKTSVICYHVNTQKVEVARRDRPHNLASNWCETFENLLHIDIAPLRITISGILHSKNWTMIFIDIRGPWLCRYKYT